MYNNVVQVLPGLVDRLVFTDGGTLTPLNNSGIVWGLAGTACAFFAEGGFILFLVIFLVVFTLYKEEFIIVLPVNQLGRRAEFIFKKLLQLLTQLISRRSVVVLVLQAEDVANVLK